MRAMLYLSIRYMAAKKIAELEAIVSGAGRCDAAAHFGSAPHGRSLRLRHSRDLEDSATEGLAPPGVSEASRASSSTRREGLWIHYRLADASDPVLARDCDRGPSRLDPHRRGASGRGAAAKEDWLLYAHPRCDRRTALLRTGEPWPQCQLIAPPGERRRSRPWAAESRTISRSTA